MALTEWFPANRAMSTSEAADRGPSTSGRPTQLDPIVDLSSCTLLSQGAEARVWETVFLGRPTVIKQRFSKKYRHPTLDAKLTITRLKGEARSLMKARKLGVPTPALYFVEHEASCLYMERVQGHSIKALLSGGALGSEAVAALMVQVGRQVAALHDGGLIHGDLTTSNLLVRDADQSVVVIDFGLSYNASLPEDKAVDLYVMERAMTSAHSQIPGLFDQVLASYKSTSRMWSATFNRFAEARLKLQR